MTGYKKLWQAVVFQAFRDATAKQPSGSESIRAKRDADSWIRWAGKDFREVCENAGFDPDFLSEAYKAGRVNGDLLRSIERGRV